MGVKEVIKVTKKGVVKVGEKELSDRMVDLELKHVLASESQKALDLKVEDHREEQIEINKRLTDMLSEVKTTVYGHYNSPENGLVAQTKKNTSWIDEKNGWRNTTINIVYRAIILGLIAIIFNKVSGQ